MSEPRTSFSWSEIAPRGAERTASSRAEGRSRLAGALTTVRTPGIAVTSEWLYAIGLVVGLIHLVDVLAANAERPGQFIPAVAVWVVMLGIWVFDRSLRTGWTAILLIPAALVWTYGGIERHVTPLIRTGNEPAAVSGTFSTAIGVGLIGLAVVSIVRWRREVTGRRPTA